MVGNIHFISIPIFRGRGDEKPGACGRVGKKEPGIKGKTLFWDTVSKTNFVSCGCSHTASTFKNTFQWFSCILSLFLLFNSLVNHSVTVGNNSIQNKLKQDFENKIHTNATCVLHVFPTASTVKSHTLSCTHVNYHLLPIYLSDFPC